MFAKFVAENVATSTTSVVVTVTVFERSSHGERICATIRHPWVRFALFLADSDGDAITTMIQNRSRQLRSNVIDGTNVQERPIVRLQPRPQSIPISLLEIAYLPFANRLCEHWDVDCRKHAIVIRDARCCRARCAERQRRKHQIQQITVHVSRLSDQLRQTVFTSELLNSFAQIVMRITCDV